MISSGEPKLTTRQPSVSCELFCPKIYSYLVYRVNGRSEVAEDLTAEVFVKALRNLHMFEFRDVPFSSWLYRIAHNQVVDYGRRRRDHRTTHLDEVPHLLVERDRLDGCLVRQMLAAALAEVSEAQRQVVLLRVVQGLSIAETAVALVKSQDAVKQLQRRGRSALKRVLQAKGDTSGRQHCLRRLEPNGRRTRARASRRMP